MNSSSKRYLPVVAGILLVLVAIIWIPGTIKKKGRNRSETISQLLSERKTKSDNLRKAMRFLQMMTPLNRSETTKEVQLELNTWLQTVDRSSVNYSPPELLRGLPPEMLEVAGCKTPIELQFSEWDVDYLFERRMMSKLARWIVEFPLRDSLVRIAVEEKKKTLDAKQSMQLEDACKLFDWAMRNVALESEASSVEELSTDPAGPISDTGLGFGYLPWETLLFSTGDFIEKGRVFTALANQRGIDTAWISINADSGPGKIWAIGVVIADSMLIFEPKLAMPVLDPDSGEFATLDDAITNERVLRRLDLAGQFDYAVDFGDLNSLQLLIDLPPTAVSARMKMLETSLLSDERMTVFHDLNARQSALQRVAPNTKQRLWEVPLMAQVQAASVRERLRTITDFTLNYMSLHGVWLLENPAANGRLNHLYGNFENSLDEKGALSLYMDTRIDAESIAQLEYSPEKQREMGVAKFPNEDKEQYQMRIAQMQFIFRMAKVDSAYLMAQLHFDRGNYSDAEKWFLNRVVESGEPLAEKWGPISRYCLGRIYQEQGDLTNATKQLEFSPSPQEAGNRLRLRYLKRILETP